MKTMKRPRWSPIITSYGLSLLVALSLLVVWVIYVLRSIARLTELASRVGVSSGNFPWIVLVVGCALFFVLIAGVTLQLAQNLAERRYSRKQEEFISNITHEMKSPLAAIRLHAQTLEQEDLSEAERRRSLSFILQQVERMGRLVDNVLESSRLVARKRQLELEPLHLPAFLAGYFEEVEARAESQAVELQTRVDTDAYVLADEDALHRVLDNLIDNALRYTSREGQIRCRVTDWNGRVRLEVADDGVGIPKKDLTKIFDRFYQADREASGRRQGSGLGLAIVSELVREMGGTVTAHSHEGRPGTRFIIELPRASDTQLRETA